MLSATASSELDDAPELWGVSRVAAALGVSNVTAGAYLRTERIPAVAIEGRLYARRADVERFLAQFPAPIPRSRRARVLDAIELKSAPATERQRKVFAGSSVELKADDSTGEFVALVYLCTGEADLDGDLVAPSAFHDGDDLVISPWGHSSFGSALPAGRATLKVDGNRILALGRFFLDAAQGADTYATVKQLAERCEWSIGYRANEARYPTADEEAAGVLRVIGDITVFESSPVLKGAAGPGRSGTLDVKAAPDLKELVEIRNAQARRDREQLVREEPKRRAIPAATRVAAEDAVKLGARILGAKAAPRVRFMTTARGKAERALGLTFTFRRDELWVREDLSAKEAFITAAHELAHNLRSEWSESDVEAFATMLEAISAKDADLLVGDPDRTPIPSAGATFLIHDLVVYEAVVADEANIRAKRWRVPSRASIERDHPSAYLSPEHRGPSTVELCWREVLSLV